MTMWAAVYGAEHTVLGWGHSGGLWLGSLTIARAEAVRHAQRAVRNISHNQLLGKAWQGDRAAEGAKRASDRERDREGNKIATTRHGTLAAKAKAKRQTCSNNKNKEKKEGEEGDCKEEKKHDRDYEELQDKQARRQYKHTHKHTN